MELASQDRSPRTTSWIRIATIVVVFGSAVIAGIAVGAGAPSDGIGGPIEDEPQPLAATATDVPPDIIETQRLALAPDHPGEIEATHEFEIPADVSSFELRLGERMTFLTAVGFSRSNGTTLVWDEETMAPSITYHVEVDRAIERDDPIAAPGDQLFIDAGDWALFQRPQLMYAWHWSGDHRVALSRSVEPDGPGVAGDVLVFLGAHEVHTHSAHGQSFVLVEPAAAEMVEDPERVLAALEYASDRLRVGERDETVLLIVAPTGDVRWGLRGLQVGPSDMWIRDVERLDDPTNVWLHEYVHARQGYRADDSARWLAEGTATYYAALLALETDRITHAEFRQLLDGGTDSRYDGVRLTDPATWEADADYVVGSLVTGSLDRTIRLEQQAGRSFDDVFRRLNELDVPVDHDTVVETVAAIGGSEIATNGDRYLSTADRPVVWDEEAHADAFEIDPARFAYRLAESGGVWVSGPYRDRPLSGSDTIVVVPGERLAINVTVTNLGEAGGTYDARPRFGTVSGERLSGYLAPGETEDARIVGTLDEVGSHTIALGEARVPVRVRSPAHVNVTSLSVNPRVVAPGEELTVRVEVRNDANFPGETVVRVRADDQPLFDEPVVLDAGADRELVRRVRLDSPGTATLTVDDTDLSPVVVEVRAHAVSVDRLDGFGLVATVLALLVAARFAMRGASSRFEE